MRLYFQLEAPKTEVFGPDFDEIFQDRQKEADLFYDEVWHYFDYFDVRFFLIAMSLKYDKFTRNF